LHALIVEQIGDDEELERAMDALRTFKNQQVLRVAASDVTQQFPIAEVSNQLTYIAEACLARALALAWRDLTRRFGAPRVAGDEAERAAGFAVIGYGKLGGWELGYGSDLDLVFVHDCRDEGALTTGERALEHGVFFGRLAQRLIHI
jgi:glutamate-ammonia-ligase adenylyltransferase